ncbi:hypothetical protein [Sphingosinicella rhizophila]|uniref:Uncharacterized protein n=1 Tax=Sphingosinicella rhizophila TaxID=3050082 RepID=A0ABU3QCX1_9SPHN|nr:hypothetical protein [Sphingosinicella sp. GR2756]MDT9600838.1 hypothetical protein [Sphingosinicella sp. GR2756]
MVEADRKVVGLAVRIPGGFKFFSSDPDFKKIDAEIFPRARTMARRVAEIARARRLPFASEVGPASSMH